MFALELSGLEDAANEAEESGAFHRAGKVRDSVKDYHQQLNEFKREFQTLFKDYSGYESPPVLPPLPVFRELDPAAWVSEKEGQYLLGSLDLEEEAGNSVVEWCSRLQGLEENVNRLKNVIRELAEEKKQRDFEAEALKQKNALEKQESLMKQMLKQQEEQQKQIRRDLRKIQQQQKVLEKRDKELQEKEQQALIEQKESQVRQTRLEEQEAGLREREKLVRQREEVMGNLSKKMKSQQQESQKLLTQLSRMLAGMRQRPEDEAAATLSPNDVDRMEFHTEQEMLVQQQQELLSGLRKERDRLDQDKTWVKNLLKRLLDQHEKIQEAQDKVREVEREAISRQEDELQQERGWIKVERSRLRKEEIREEKDGRPVSDPLH